MSPHADRADIQLGERLGLKPGTVVQELGWDDDVDDSIRAAIEDGIDSDLVDGDYGDVVDVVLLWWRDDDGDLVDALVDSLTDLVRGGAIWLLTPKVDRSGDIKSPITPPSPPSLRATIASKAPRGRGERETS